MSPGIDLAQVRADTPAAATLVHLNNAGSSLPPRPVHDAVVGHLEREAAIGGYEAAAEAAGGVTDTYAALAELVGGRPEEIAYLESATRAWTQVAHGLAWRPGDRALVSVSEYASNVLGLLQLVERHGITVEVVPDDAHGQLDVDALAGLLDERVRLVAVTHAPTQGGLINPAEAIGATLRAAGSDAVYLLDACQSVGQLDVDVRRIGCHALSATGRKFLRGPRGTGFLWIAAEVLDRVTPPAIDLAAATWVADDRYELAPGATRFECWERSVAGVIGLGVAARYALALGLPAIEARVGTLAEGLRSRLRELPGVEVRDRGVRRSGICTFTVEGVAAADIAAGLRTRQVNVNVSVVTSARFDLAGRGLTELVRASVHYYLTDDDLDRAVAELAAVLDDLRR